MYKPKLIIIALIGLSVFIIYAILFALIESKAEDQQFKTFEVVTGLSGLLLSAVGAIYVYNAYEAQREQIKLQKEEIGRNRQDVEFNRIVDILYRQLEASSKVIFGNRYQAMEKQFNVMIQSDEDFDLDYDYFEEYYEEDLSYMINALEAFSTLKYILTENKLSNENRFFLEKIFISHIGAEYFLVLEKVSFADQNYPEQLQSLSKVINNILDIYYHIAKRGL